MLMRKNYVDCMNSGFRFAILMYVVVSIAVVHIFTRLETTSRFMKMLSKVYGLKRDNHCTHKLLSNHTIQIYQMHLNIQQLIRHRISNVSLEP